MRGTALLPLRLVPIMIMGAAFGLCLSAGAAAAAAEAEPNDDAAHANVIALGNLVSASQTANDLDWYNFSVPAPGIILVHLTGSVPSAGIYDASQWALLAPRHDFGGGNVEYPVVVAQPGVHYVQLTPFGPGTYTLNVSFFSGFSSISGTNENEYNNDASNATVMAGSSWYGGLAGTSYGDVDWWRFDLPESGTLLLTGDFSPTTWRVWDATGSVPLPYTYGGTTSDIRLGFRLDGPTSVLLEFRSPSSWSTVRYTLKGEFTAGFAAFTGQNEVELNDQAAQANPIALNSTVLGLSSATYGDVDWWFIDTPESGIVTLTVTSPSAYVNIFDADGVSSILGATTSWDANGFVFVFGSSGGARALLRATGWADSSYSINVTFAPGDGSYRGVDEVEPNAAAENATNAPLGVDLAGRTSSAVQDIDTWRLNFTEAGLADITVSNCCWGGWGNAVAFPLAMTILNADSGEVLYPGTTYPCPTCSQTYGIIVEGPLSLLLRIQQTSPSFEGSASVDYTVHTAFNTSFAALQGLDETEPNNRVASASAFPANATARGRVDVAHLDTDWWRYIAPQSGWVAIEALPGSASLYFAVRDAEGGPSLSTSQLPDGRTLFQVVAGSAFMILAGSGEGNYALALTFEPTVGGFFEGPDEAEPNDDPAGAQVLPGSGTFSGVLDAFFDETDQFAVQLTAGDFVLVSYKDLGTYGDAQFSLWLDPVDTAPNPDFDSFSQYGANPLLFANVDGSLHIGVNTHERQVRYSITVNVTHTYYMGDGKLDFNEALGDARFGFSLRPPEASPLDPRQFHNGDGRIFGHALCAWHTLANTLAPIEVHRGLLFSPVSTGRAFVASSDEVLRIPVKVPVCFSALSLYKGGMDQPGVNVAPTGYVEGDAATVVNEISLVQAGGERAVLALWAVTSLPTLAELELWRVSATTVTAANQILIDAGVSARLPVPEPPPPPVRVDDPAPAAAPLNIATIGVIGGIVGGVAGLAIVTQMAKRRARQDARVRAMYGAAPRGGTPTAPASEAGYVAPAEAPITPAPDRPYPSYPSYPPYAPAFVPRMGSPSDPLPPKPSPPHVPGSVASPYAALPPATPRGPQPPPPRPPPAVTMAPPRNLPPGHPVCENCKAPLSPGYSACRSCGQAV